MSPRSDEHFVYSSDHGRMCPTCSTPREKCQCGKPQVPPGDGIVRVSLDRKGRRGKGVSVVTGVPLAGDELTALAKALKTRCGSGGTVKLGTIEVQGDHRDLLVEELKKLGYQVKRAGG